MSCCHFCSSFSSFSVLRCTCSMQGHGAEQLAGHGERAAGGAWSRTDGSMGQNSWQGSREHTHGPRVPTGDTQPPLPAACAALRAAVVELILAANSMPLHSALPKDATSSPPPPPWPCPSAPSPMPPSLLPGPGTALSARHNRRARVRSEARYVAAPAVRISTCHQSGGACPPVAAAPNPSIAGTADRPLS